MIALSWSSLDVNLLNISWASLASICFHSFFRIYELVSAVKADLTCVKYVIIVLLNASGGKPCLVSLYFSNWLNLWPQEYLTSLQNQKSINTCFNKFEIWRENLGACQKVWKPLLSLLEPCECNRKSDDAASQWKLGWFPVTSKGQAYNSTTNSELSTWDGYWILTVESKQTW